MAGSRFRAARAAALTFLSEVPDDVRVGLVSFAGHVTTVQEPTRDRTALRAAVTQLRLTEGTQLFAGVRTSLAVVAANDAANLVVLSEGRDTSGSSLSPVLAAVRRSGAPWTSSRSTSRGRRAEEKAQRVPVKILSR